MQFVASLNFLCCKKWLPEIRHHCPTATVLLVGTKSDLRNNNEIIQRLAEKNQTPVSSIKAQDIVQNGFIECSALELQNVKLVFDAAIRSFLSKSQSNESLKKSKRNRCSIM